MGELKRRKGPVVHLDCERNERNQQFWSAEDELGILLISVPPLFRLGKQGVGKGVMSGEAG